MTHRPLSARNPRVARLARLARQRSVRAEERAFVVEGPKLIGEALRARYPLLELYLEATALDRPAVADVLVEVDAAQAIPVWEVPEGTLSRTSDATTSQGVVAVAEWTDHAMADPGAPLLEVVAYGIGDPGNLGTLMRAAEAAGAHRVVVAGGSVDPTNPKCVRASAGSLFHVPVLSVDGEAHLRRLGESGVCRIATDVRDGTPYDEVDLTAPTAIVLGSEAHGLPTDVADLVDVRVTIPMAGRAESLNVAMAGSVLCFEALRQRRARGEVVAP